MLARAVADAGGVGALALTWVPRDRVADQVRLARASDGGVQGNFVLAFDASSLRHALDAGLRIVTFSWGQPRKQAALVRGAGASFGVQVTTVSDARAALDLGAEFLICQGNEAGGHVQSTQPLSTVLPLILAEAGGQPVIAAGGLATGHDISRVLEAGATAAMLGTRFVATTESRAHPVYKARIVSAKAENSVLTSCFDGGWPDAPHRVLKNSTMEIWEAAGCPPRGQRPHEGRLLARVDGCDVHSYDDAPPVASTVADEGAEAMALYAGTGCGDIHDVPPAGDLVRRLWSDCQALQASTP